QFQAHMKNLELYSEGFPQAGSVKLDSDVPALEETADVLELMLQFMHHTRQPDLSEVSFTLLSSLAEAVEKYMIYSAMDICKVLSIEEHPLDVLVYAQKHDYTKLANKAAPLTIAMNSKEVVAKANAARLYDSFIVTWFRYRDDHVDAARPILRNAPVAPILHKGGYEDCGLWATFAQAVRLASVDVDCLRPKDIENIMQAQSASLMGCMYCSKRADNWKRQAAVAQANIPAFCKV
ncbi:hypothetical protein BDN70DRAFT_818431, partial [Pholiota conissans]